MMKFELLFLTFACITLSYAQKSLSFVSQKGDTLQIPSYVKISLPDSALLNEYAKTVVNAKQTLITVNDNYPYVVVEVGKFTCNKGYYNEYSIDQFKKLTSIKLFESCLKTDLKPRVFLSELNEWKKDSVEVDWLKGYLKEYKHHSQTDTIHISLYSSKSISIFGKSKIRRRIKNALDFAGVEYAEIEIDYMNKPYSAKEVDLFTTETLITSDFVRKQNSPRMKKEAKRLSIVAFVD